MSWNFFDPLSRALIPFRDFIEGNGQHTAAHAAVAEPSGGAVPYRNINLGITGQVVKASPGQVYGCMLSNLSNAFVFVKLYDKVAAATVSDTPVATIPLSPGAVNVLLGIPSVGLQFLLGIGIRASALLADNDNTAPPANAAIVAMYFK